MILRKPYAFLIKHFRIIHLLLLLPMAYLIHRTFLIVSFFRTYVKNNYTTTIIQIAAEHISFFMYLAVLMIVLVILPIYYLMRQKRKSIKLYFFTLLYYLLLFVLIGVTYSILSNMEHNLITAQTARAYRDISIVLCLPQYFFFGYIFMRGIGFDLKRFNFANDLKDLEITAIDSEEFEFNVNIEGYKVERTLRRFLREMKYYIRENTFVFGCIFVSFVIFVGTSLYFHFGVYNKTYHISDKMTHNYFNIQIIDSMVTNLGYDGNIITKGKYYLVLKLWIENRTAMDYELDYTNFRLVLNGKNIYPTLDRGEYFVDFAKPYRSEKIKRQSKDYYVLAYEFDESYLTNMYTIKILESISYKVGDIAAKYKNIQLNPTKINNVKEVQKENMGASITLNESNLLNTTFQLEQYEFASSFMYEYDYCINSSCRKLKNRITPNISGSIEKTTLLILDMNYHLDSEAIYTNFIKNNLKFLDQFFSLRIVKNVETLILPLKNRTNEHIQNKVIFETRSEAREADTVELLLTVRDKRYVYLLR